MIIKRVSSPLSAENMLKRLQMARFPLGFSQKGINPIDVRYKIRFDSQFYISFLNKFDTTIEKPKKSLGVLGDCYTSKVTSSILSPYKVSENVTAYGLRIKDILNKDKFSDYLFYRYSRILGIDMYNIHYFYRRFRGIEEKRNKLLSDILKRCSYLPYLEKATGLNFANDDDLIYCITTYFSKAEISDTRQKLESILRESFKKEFYFLFNKMSFAFPVTLKYSDNIVVLDMFPFFVLDTSKRQPVLYYSGGVIKGREELLSTPLEKQISMDNGILNPIAKFTKKDEYDYVLAPYNLKGVFMDIRRFN